MTDVLDPPAPSFAPARINRRLPAHPVVAIVGAGGQQEEPGCGDARGATA